MYGTIWCLTEQTVFLTIILNMKYIKSICAKYNYLLLCQFIN